MTISIPSGSNVLVTGATGFTGSLLVKKLVAQGARVRAIARATSKLDALSSLPITWIRGAVYDPEVVAAATTGIDYIFHVAAAYRQAGIEDEEYFRVHVTSTELLAAAAIKQPRFKCFVHVSTVGVHGHIDEPPADETYRFGPGDLYQKSKLKGELWLHEFGKTTGLPYTVIRPAAIYGPEDARLFKVFKMASRPFFPILGYGQCLYHLIHVDDLTDAMICAATSERALGEAFIIGNETPVELPWMARTIASALGKRTRIVRIPATPFFWAAGVCETVCPLLGVEPPLYRRRVAFFTKDRSFNTSKMRNVLGFSPATSNEEGIRKTAQWYRDNGWL